MTFSDAFYLALLRVKSILYSSYNADFYSIEMLCALANNEKCHTRINTRALKQYYMDCEHVEVYSYCILCVYFQSVLIGK